MAKKIVDDGILRFESDFSKEVSRTVTFDSDQFREFVRSRPEKIAVLTTMFIAGFCEALGNNESETDMYWAVALHDLERCLKKFKE